MNISLKENASRFIWPGLTLILLALATVVGWLITNYLGQKAFEEIRQENNSAVLALYIHLTDELNKIEGAVKAMSGSPYVVPALQNPTKLNIHKINTSLDRYNAALGASVSYVIDRNGKVIASSNRNDSDSFVNQSYKFRRYFTETIAGKADHYFALGVTSGRRGFYASYPLREDHDRVIGVVVMKKDLDDIERSVKNYPYFFVLTPHGIIFLSSNNNMLFKSLWPIDRQTEKEIIESKQFGNGPFEAIFRDKFTDGAIINYSGNDYLVSSMPLSAEGWSIVLMSTTGRVIIYKSAGVVLTLLFYAIIVVPLIVHYKSGKMAEFFRESEQRFRKLADSTFEGIVIHDNGEILDVNDSCTRMFGYDYNDVIGRKVLELVVPGARYIAKQMIDAAVEKTYEIDLLHKSGKIITVEAAGKPIYFKGRKAQVVALRDITERKRSEQALHNAEELYRTLAEKSFAGVFVIQDGRFRFLNSKAATTFTGYKTEELIGSESIQYIHPDDRQKAMVSAKAMLKGEISSPYEFRIITKQGEVRWILETDTAIHYEGRPAVLGNSMDITDRKKMEEEIKAVSITDQLTGLYNRRGFLSFAEQQIKINERTGNGFLLLYADLDGMKEINDKLGHSRGDEALIETADVFREVFRESDIIARIGGDEYAVLALGSSMEHAAQLNERIQQFINEHNKREGREYYLSVSSGVVYCDPDSASGIDELMARADRLMYEQKKDKKAAASLK